MGKNSLRANLRLADIDQLKPYTDQGMVGICILDIPGRGGNCMTLVHGRLGELRPLNPPSRKPWAEEITFSAPELDHMKAQIEHDSNTYGEIRRKNSDSGLLPVLGEITRRYMPEVVRLPSDRNDREQIAKLVAKFDAGYVLYRIDKGADGLIAELRRPKQRLFKGQTTYFKKF
jgi:hypothetical protein